MAFLVAALAAGPALAAEARDADRPAILFLGSRPEQLRTWDDWLTAGFEIDVRKIESIRSAEDLRGFNVVVINFLPSVESGAVMKEQARFEPILRQYMRRGGGVVVFCGGGAWQGMSPALRHLLKPYGASVPEEQIVDPKHEMPKVGYGHFRANTTTDIARAPMTQGIGMLGYIGQASRADVMKLMMPVVIQDRKAWHVVVRAEKSAYSAVGLKPGTGPELKKTPATYPSAPVMAAWRNVDKGRLFLYPHNVCITVTSPELFENRFWDAEDKTKKGVPQNRSFIMQTVRWAAEPSLASGTFGGFKTTQTETRKKKLLLFAQPPCDWTKAPSGEKLSPKMGMLRGLIGARSTLSGGTHSVEALCAAARGAGLDFLGFTEKLDRLDKGRWEQLKAECKKQSDDRFLALPGLTAPDTIGNTWFGLGWVDFPTPTTVTPDGKRFDNTYSLYSKQFGRRLIGFADVGKNPSPWFEMKQASAMAVRTLRSGKLVDDATEVYFRSCYDIENYLPFVFHEVATPGQVASAAKGMVNVFTGPGVKALTEYATGTGGYKVHQFWEAPHPWYLTRGPRLERNGGARLHNFAIDQEAENLYRYGFKLTGLKTGDEILLRDGPKVWRKWLATGETFAAEHTWPHEQVQVFIVQVVRDGKTVLLGSPVGLNYGRRFLQCADRQNTLPFNYQPDREGNWHVTGIPVGCHYRSWAPSTLVYATGKTWQTGAIGIEFQPPLIVSWFTGPFTSFDSPRRETYTHLASRQWHRLSCPGVIIVDETCERVYPDGGKHLGDCEPPKLTEPTQLIKLEVRRYGIYGGIGQLNGQLVESTITALKDVRLKDGRKSILVSRDNYNILPGVEPWVEQSSDGKVVRYAIAKADNKYKHGPFKQGDYIGTYPMGLAGGGAQYAVSGDVTFALQSRPGSTWSGVMLNVPNQWKKGQQFRYAIFYTIGGSVPYRPTSDYQKAARFLGLTGSFPAIQGLTGGTLQPTPVIATIHTKPESVVRFKTVKNEDDPISLPVRIKGFNPNWQTAYMFDGSRKWRFFGELDGYGYMNLYTTTSAHTVVAGHPVLADRDDVRITLDDPLGGQSAFEVYNPTDRPMTVHLRTNEAFLPARKLTVRLKPFESYRVRVSDQRCDQ